MQKQRYSSIEAITDGILSIIVNMLGQMLVYGPAATGGKITSFACIFFALVYARRWCTRRIFERLVAPGTKQSRTQSLIEVGTDTVVGILVALVMQHLMYRDAATAGRATLLVVGLYALTMLRRYLLRRLFVKLAAGQSKQDPEPIYQEATS